MRTKVRCNSRYFNELKNVIVEHINLNLKDYLILSIVFVLGVIIGVVIINNSNEESKVEISGYINSFINTIKNEKYEINKIELVKMSIIKNLKLVLIIWLAGSTIIGIPLIYIITVYKGICIGYTISAIIASLGVGRGIGFSLASLCMQNIIVIPIILMLSVSALKLYRVLINKNTSVKQEVIRHTIFCGILIVPLIVASLIEAYFSSSLICLYN